MKVLLAYRKDKLGKIRMNPVMSLASGRQSDSELTDCRVASHFIKLSKLALKPSL